MPDIVRFRRSRPCRPVAVRPVHPPPWHCPIRTRRSPCASSPRSWTGWWTEPTRASAAPLILSLPKDAEREGVADDLFRVAFANEPARVLDAEPGTRVCRELFARADKALRLSPGELELCLRVGALNQRLEADGRWDKLDWSDKLVLASLTRLDDGMETFQEGLRTAMLPSMRAGALRTWVGSKMPARNPGRPEGLSFRGRAQLTDGGLRLSDPERRTRFAGQFRAAPPRERRRFLKELRDAHRNLGLLLDELVGAPQP